jgi:hypothetical protein
MRLALAALQRYVVRGGWLNQFSTIRERQWLQTSPDATDLGIAKVVSLESGNGSRASSTSMQQKKGAAMLSCHRAPKKADVRSQMPSKLP